VGLISPQPPRYDLAEVRALPYDQRICRACIDWVEQGFGAPIGAHAFARPFPADVIEVTVNRIAAFRAMHMHDRLVQRLICEAVDDPDAYEIRDGELLAGVVLGWNFGDGHLHHEQLMDALQQRCGFAPGEVRAVMIESQPIHRSEWHWLIVDAAEGLLAEGHAPVADALVQQPWPDPLVGPAGAGGAAATTADPSGEGADGPGSGTAGG
jgi:hypothetical protein